MTWASKAQYVLRHVFILCCQLMMNPMHAHNVESQFLVDGIVD